MALLRLNLKFWGLLISPAPANPAEPPPSEGERWSDSGAAAAVLAAAQRLLFRAEAAELDLARAQESARKLSLELSSVTEEQRTLEERFNGGQILEGIDWARLSTARARVPQLEESTARSEGLAAAAGGELQVALKEAEALVSRLGSSVPMRTIVAMRMHAPPPSDPMGPNKQVTAAESAVEEVEVLQGKLAEAEVALQALRGDLAQLQKSEQELEAHQLRARGPELESSQAELAAVMVSIEEAERDVEGVSDSVRTLTSKMQHAEAAAQAELNRANSLMFPAPVLQVIASFTSRYKHDRPIALQAAAGQ